MGITQAIRDTKNEHLAMMMGHSNWLKKPTWGPSMMIQIIGEFQLLVRELGFSHKRERERYILGR